MDKNRRWAAVAIAILFFGLTGYGFWSVWGGPVGSPAPLPEETPSPSPFGHYDVSMIGGDVTGGEGTPIPPQTEEPTPKVNNGGGSSFRVSSGSGSSGSTTNDGTTNDGTTNDGTTNDGTDNGGTDKTPEVPEEIPEFTTVAIPVAAILGLLFFFNHGNHRKE
jgi:hypothetical protein